MRCKSCGSTKIIYDPFRGEYFCGECGLVNGRLHVFTKKKETAPTLFLGSFTYFRNPRFKGISKRIMADVIRQGHNGTYQKGKAYALNEIFRINAVLNLPPIVRFQAVQIYEDVVTHTTILMDKRITLESLSTAAVMMAMEILDFERPFEEILDASKSTRERIEVSFEKVKNYLNRRGK